MNKKIVTHIVISAALVLPLVSLAADLASLLTTWTGYIKLILNFLLVLATLVFVWGIVKYVSAGGDATKVTEARNYMIWGIVGLAIMGSVWVLVNWLTGSFLTGGDNKIPTPYQ